MSFVWFFWQMGMVFFWSHSMTAFNLLCRLAVPLSFLWTRHTHRHRRKIIYGLKRQQQKLINSGLMMHTIKWTGKVESCILLWAGYKSKGNQGKCLGDRKLRIKQTVWGHQTVWGQQTENLANRLWHSEYLLH